MKTTSSIAAVVLCVALASCCPCRKSKSASATPLEGTTWHLTQLYNQPLDVTGYDVTLTPDGRIGGIAECNRFAGSFTVRDRTLTIADNLVSTRMMCIGNPDREAKFLDMLRIVDGFSIDGERLMMLKGGDVVAIFDKVDPEKSPEERGRTTVDGFRPLGPPILMDAEDVK